MVNRAEELITRIDELERDLSLAHMACELAEEELAALKAKQPSAVHLLFDGPPGPECGRLVEAEDPTGKSINVGEWSQRPDGYWQLVIQQPTAGVVDERAAFEAFNYSGRFFRLRREGQRYVYATTENELVAFRAGAAWQASQPLPCAGCARAVPGWADAVEACAKLCEARAAYYESGDDDAPGSRRGNACRHCADVIRYNLAATPSAKKEDE